MELGKVAADENWKSSDQQIVRVLNFFKIFRIKEQVRLTQNFLTFK